MIISNPTIHQTQLARDLSFFDITMIGVGAMIGAGIFLLTGIAAGVAGPALILAIFVGSGFFQIWQHLEFLDKFTPLAPEGLSGVFCAMGLTYITYEGYEIIVQTGEEVKYPRRNIPRAIFWSIAIVVPLYILVAFVALGAVQPETNEPTWRWLGQHAEIGLAEAALQFMPLGTFLLLVGGLLFTMSALNATTFSYNNSKLVLQPINPPFRAKHKCNHT